MNDVAFLGRLVLGVVFVVAGAAKLREPERFERALRAYELASDRVVRTVARALPPIELVSGALLLLGLITRPAAVFTVALLVSFTVVMIMQLVRGRSVDCGCFGSIGMHRITWVAVARNLSLAALAALVAVHPFTAMAIDQLIGHHAATVSGSDALALLATGVLVAFGWSLARETRRLRHILLTQPAAEQSTQ